MTLFLMEAAGSDEEALAKARAVPQAFSWPAFLLGPFWLLYRRLWLLLAAWLAAEVAFSVFARPHLSLATTILVLFLAHLWLGFDAAHRRSRKPALFTDVVEGRTRDAAESRFFRDVLRRDDRAAPPPAHDAAGEDTLA